MSFVRTALFPLLLAGLLLSATGCGTSEALIEQHEQALDSLRAERDLWQLRYEDARDSLHFLQDIDSGRYYRERRLLRDRLDRMRYDINVLRDGGRTVSVIEADDLFNSASAELSETGTRRLDDLVEELESLYPNRPLRIEGHADNVPITGALQERYPTNWELSAARAVAVARYLMEEHDFAADRFLVVAFGDTQPVASNDTSRGRQRNRRVRVAVLPEPLDHARPFGEDW